MGRRAQDLPSSSPRRNVRAGWDFSPSTLKLIRGLGLVYDSWLIADDELMADDELWYRSWGSENATLCHGTGAPAAGIATGGPSSCLV